MFDIFKITPKVYNKKRAAFLVLSIRHCKNPRESQLLKLELFELMAKLVVKNINNYLKLSYNSPIKQESFASNEMQSEAFIVLDRCIKQFKFGKGWCFYFYYNKSLSRSFYKIFNQMIVGKERFEGLADATMIRKNKSTNNLYGIDFVISQLGLDDDEIKVLNSKLLGQSKQDFLEENKKFPSIKYYNCNKKIKEIMLKMIENGEL